MTMTGRDHTPVTTLGSEKQNALIQAVWELAQQNSSTLTTFRIDKSFARPSLHTINPAAPPTEAMYNTIRNLSNLLELEIIDDKADFDRVLRMASPQLKYLCAPGWIQLRGTDGQLLHETFTSVRTVELFQETDLRAVFSLLRYLPNLESLLLTGGFNQELFQNDQLEAMEARTRMDNTPNRSLRQLTLYGIQFMDTRIMTTVFPWIPELREFSCDELCLDMSEALVRHCQHLEVVCELDTFGGDYETRSERRGFDIVMPLLKGCPSLRVLDTVAQRIQGDSFIGYEIVCLERLETFRCQIGGMCRLDEAISRVLNLTLTGDSDGDTEEQGGGGQGIGSVASRADKERGLFDEIRRNEERYRKVYKQLSKMTKLRVLELGQEYRAEPDTFGSSQSALNGMSSDFDEDEDDDYVDYNWYRPPIEDTLDLTLASGLNQLETLKNLEVFGFEGVDHRMEKVEMDWMAAKWPKLKVMRGIHVDILPNVEPDTKRTELREYMQMLRPEVVHETLYKRRRVFSR
ncbi:hypothetical protein BGW39_004429 [Mortierella sp. 14UC]|nr:hypothetical protein BGW39_004429 [Mortierella sp. 14UC]